METKTSDDGGAAAIAADAASGHVGQNQQRQRQREHEQQQQQQRERRTLLARFAAVADIQHADREDAPSFSGITRRYRDALLTARDSALSIAEEGLRRGGGAEREGGSAAEEEEEEGRAAAAASAAPEFVLHLGDLVDMSEAAGRPREAFRRALDALSLSGIDQAHVLGNHCLASWPGRREELHEELGLFGWGDDAADDADDAGAGENGNAKNIKRRSAPEEASFCPERGYYARSYGREGKLRLIVLDGFDVSVMGRGRDDRNHPKRLLAESILRTRNPHNEAGGWFSAEGLVGVDRRFVCFGGGVGEEQLRWLSSQLAGAERRGQRAVVAVHQPLLPGTANPLCLLWNYDEVLRVLEPFGKKGVVVATFAGHSHKDGSGVCEGGVLHRVVRGVIEHERFHGDEKEIDNGEEGDDDEAGRRCCCHAVVDVFDDGSVVVRGRGCDDSEHFRT